MKSGLEDRNNTLRKTIRPSFGHNVSMKSGLEDRNNLAKAGDCFDRNCVSMKSGLEDRNNLPQNPGYEKAAEFVSMKSGLEDRNNLEWS